jgi:aspartate-semialdehyde dehydrogenase
VINGHSEAIYLECSHRVDRDAVIRELKTAQELIVYDDLAENGVCTPRFNRSPDSVHVGRIRINPDNPKGLWLWVMADNLRIGAALNAIQIAEKLVESGRYRNEN